MHLISGMPTTKNECMMASPLLHYVIFADAQGIGMLTAPHNAEAFPHLEEIHAEKWQEKIDTLTLSIWRMKTMKNSLWETKQEYIEEWQRQTLITTTSRYHNLVVCWNVGTLPQGPTNPPCMMEHATYYLTDNKQMDPSVVLLESEGSLRN